MNCSSDIVASLIHSIYVHIVCTRRRSASGPSLRYKTIIVTLVCDGCISHKHITTYIHTISKIYNMTFKYYCKAIYHHMKRKQTSLRAYNVVYYLSYIYIYISTSAPVRPPSHSLVVRSCLRSYQCGLSVGSLINWTAQSWGLRCPSASRDAVRPSWWWRPADV